MAINSGSFFRKSVPRKRNGHGKARPILYNCMGVFLSVNPKTDFRSGESFLKKDSLDLKSEESKSRLTD